MTLTPHPAAIVLDWGTSSFRALLVASRGEVLDRVETGEGIQSISGGAFEQTLTKAIAPWRTAFGALPIYAAGMIGSRNGWVEMPYVPAPAGVADLARATRRIPLSDGSTITFIPGLCDPAASPFPDVMRGEETQLVGLGLDRPQTVVLPGTHAKWARVGGGRIQAFQTFVTGEVFGTLSRHSFLARVARPRSTPNWEAFRQGATLALADGRPAAGLLARLFAVRTGWLAGKLDPQDMTDYLSGLVVGSEFLEARNAGWYSAGDTVSIVGDDDLVEVYSRAAEIMEITPVVGPEDAALRGVLEIAQICASPGPHQEVVRDDRPSTAA
jgi:2-dehydro-3-deoxygalactonokinase